MVKPNSHQDDSAALTAQTGFARLLPPQSYPNNLPMQLNRFIGREHDLRVLKSLVWSTRLLTLTGPGGCGKTRLALEVAADLLDAFSDGVWLAELASISDAALIPRTILTALDMHEQKGRTLTEALIDQLQHRELLLVLDNCEHLIGGCANLAMALVQHCPNFRILATSRETFNIAGEIAWPVPPLSLIDPKRSVSAAILQTSEAAHLFLDRAAVQADFAVSEQTAPAIAQICRRLDGMPLAIELAAVRMKMLTVDQIAARLDDRFNLLTGGTRTALPRHQTLRAAIDWSYDLLSEPERVLLRRLSVFSGGGTLEAVEQVCPDQLRRDGVSSSQIVDLLSHLVDKSLVVVDDQGSEMRYHMLETIRQYTHERLSASGETEAIRRRHAEFFTAWVEQMAMELRAGPTQLDRFAQLEVEQGNISAVLEWSLGGADSELGLRLIGAIFFFWWRRGHWVEWEYWTTLASAHIDNVSEATRAGMLLAMSGIVFDVKRDSEASRRHSQEALALYRRLGDRYNIAWATFWLAYAAIGIREEYTRSIALIEEAIASLRQEGDLASVAQGFSILGELAYVHGDLARAKAAYQESLRIAREIGDPFREHIQYANLGDIAKAEGDYEMAVTLFKRCLSWAKERGISLGILGALADLSGVLGPRRQPQQAARLTGAIDALSDSLGVKLQPREQLDFDRLAGAVREQLGSETFEMLQGEGRALTLEQAIEYALESPTSREEVAQPRVLRQSAKREVGGLTAREREVAALIAQGKANREIAEALVVELKTVEAHITRIFNKLGFNNRVQIATWAVDKGLAPPSEK